MFGVGATVAELRIHGICLQSMRARSPSSGLNWSTPKVPKVVLVAIHVRFSFVFCV